MFNNWNIFEEAGLPLDNRIKNQLHKYYEFLIEENKKTNLTRIISEEDVYQKHFLDSVLFTQVLPLSNQSILDIGSGAGFPGIVLKIFYPDLSITLVESNSKKVRFLEATIEHLGLTKIDVVNERMEIYSRQVKEKFNIVISRAVANLKMLIEIGAQALKVGGYFIALKGPKANEEERHATRLLNEFGFKLVTKQELTSLDFGERWNLIYEKTKSTPDKYPRDYRLIKKDNR